jgi:hypothetical protein
MRTHWQQQKSKKLIPLPPKKKIGSLGCMLAHLLDPKNSYGFLGSSPFLAMAGA